MATDDPDGFDRARRRDVFLRLVAMQAKHERDRLIVTMTPLEIAEHDLVAMIEIQRQYEAGDMGPVTDSNTRAVADLVAERRADVDRLRGPEDG
jgi:hypothetical protein